MECSRLLNRSHFIPHIVHESDLWHLMYTCTGECARLLRETTKPTKNKNMPEKLKSQKNLVA